MNFKTIINKEDFKSFQKAAARNAGIKSGKSSFFRNLSIWFVIGIVIVIAVNIFKFKMIAFDFQTFVFTMLFMLGLFTFTVVRNISKMQPLENGSILGEHEYILTEDGIVDKIGSHQSSSSYKSVLNIIETEKHIFLFIDKIAGYLINKTSISSDVAVDEISSYIKKKINI